MGSCTSYIYILGGGLVFVDLLSPAVNLIHALKLRRVYICVIYEEIYSIYIYIVFDFHSPVVYSHA